MAQVLYRKYRSKKLSEIVGQEHITTTLNEALKSGRISHAYLFTGPRGVGKTSVARILAHEINKLPYSDDSPNIDIIEIDAASNRRIDEIRDLREKVHILPASADYKVYIIDEVHMLTKEAFNALLKTLEEPPAHVVFILATTDPHKLPETIISRTQRFSFKPIDPGQAIKHLRAIADEEKIKISDGALKLIAEHGEGSFRDSISLLDQLGHGSKEVTESDVRIMLGVPSAEAIDKIISLIDDPNTSYRQMSDELKTLEEQGFEPSQLTKRLMNGLRDRLIEGQLNMASVSAIGLLQELLKVDAASDPATYLLLTLLSTLKNRQTPAEPPRREEVSPVAEVKEEVVVKSERPTKKVAKSDVTVAIWPDVLNELKNRYNTLYGIVRMAEPVFQENNQLDLTFDFAFHKKQVSESKNRQIITDIILELTDQDYVIKTFVSEGGPRQSTPENIKEPESKNLDNISKIFGGGELVD